MRHFRRVSLAVLVCMVLSLTLSTNFGANVASAREKQERYVVHARSAAQFDAMKADALKAGGTIVQEDRDLDMLVVTAPTSAKTQLAASPNSGGVAKDQIRHLVNPSNAEDMFNSSFSTDRKLKRIDLGNGGKGDRKPVQADPANKLPGLLWDFNRISAPDAWTTATGRGVVVGVADTGLDFTHSELASKVVSVVDLTDPTLCTDYYGASDADFAALYGGPATTDWNGHGSWIGGNIGAALDGVGINGIAPDVKLVALKISEWCGSAYDSSILNAFLYAAKHHIPIVSISFGGYLDRSDPEQDLIYKQYEKVVDYAWRKGTVIVAAAGNEHLRIGEGGKVLSHGPLTTPGTVFEDYYGLYETPGGINHVVDVSSTGNVVNATSNNCTTANSGSSSATCKPSTDAHQPFGVGKKDQLAYYSNYGPRIDVAAPGGARKFNLPAWDRGGTPGFPVTTADDYRAWETFSITSNWALEIPCYYNIGPEFYQNECYSTIQGTSMATPHVSAALAVIASKYHDAGPRELVSILKYSARDIRGNTTPPLSATDTSVTDLTGVACTTGYCHLGGRAISDNEAYGAGLVNVANAVKGYGWGYRN